MLVKPGKPDRNLDLSALYVAQHPDSRDTGGRVTAIPGDVLQDRDHFALVKH